MNKTVKSSAILDHLAQVVKLLGVSVRTTFDDEDCEALKQTLAEAQTMWDRGVIESDQHMIQWLYLFNNLDTYPREVLFEDIENHTGHRCPAVISVPRLIMSIWINDRVHRATMQKGTA